MFLNVYEQICFTKRQDLSEYNEDEQNVLHTSKGGKTLILSMTEIP